MRWLTLAFMCLVLELLPSSLRASGLDDLYWFRFQKPACSGAADLLAALTSGAVFTKQLTLEGNYFSISQGDLARMPFSQVYEEVPLASERALAIRKILVDVGSHGQVPEIVGQGLSLSVSAFFALTGVPLWASLVGDAGLSRFLDGINAVGQPYLHAADFVAVGGVMKQVLSYSKNVNGQPTLTRAYIYEVAVGQEKRVFILASCVYAVKVAHGPIPGCPPNPDEFGPTFCRQRAEQLGFQGECGDRGLDIDGSIHSCFRDQTPLCDPDSFCSCDFNQTCYSKCTALGDCGKTGKRPS